MSQSSDDAKIKNLKNDISILKSKLDKSNNPPETKKIQEKLSEKISSLNKLESKQQGLANFANILNQTKNVKDEHNFGNVNVSDFDKLKNIRLPGPIPSNLSRQPIQNNKRQANLVPPPPPPQTQPQFRQSKNIQQQSSQQPQSSRFQPKQQSSRFQPRQKQQQQSQQSSRFQPRQQQQQSSVSTISEPQNINVNDNDNIRIEGRDSPGKWIPPRPNEGYNYWRWSRPRKVFSRIEGKKNRRVNVFKWTPSILAYSFNNKDNIPNIPKDRDDREKDDEMTISNTEANRATYHFKDIEGPNSQGQWVYFPPNNNIIEYNKHGIYWIVDDYIPNVGYKSQEKTVKTLLSLITDRKKGEKLINLIELDSGDIVKKDEYSNEEKKLIDFYKKYKNIENYSIDKLLDNLLDWDKILGDKNKQINEENKKEVINKLKYTMENIALNLNEEQIRIILMRIYMTYIHDNESTFNISKKFTENEFIDIYKNILQSRNLLANPDVVNDIIKRMKGLATKTLIHQNKYIFDLLGVKPLEEIESIESKEKRENEQGKRKIKNLFIKNNEIDNLSKNISDAVKFSSASEKDIMSAIKDSKELKQKLIERIKSENSLKTKIKNLQDKYDKLKNISTNINSRYDKMINELDKKDISEEKYKQEIDKLQKEINTLNKRLSSVTDYKILTDENLKNINSRLVTVNSSLDGQINTIDEDIDTNDILDFTNLRNSDELELYKTGGAKKKKKDMKIKKYTEIVNELDKSKIGDIINGEDSFILIKLYSDGILKKKDELKKMCELFDIDVKKNITVKGLNEELIKFIRKNCTKKLLKKILIEDK